MIEIIHGEIRKCTCDLCAHSWETLSKTAPERCPNCHKRKWNGERKMGRPKVESIELELPRPERIPI